MGKLLVVDDLKTYFFTRRGIAKAVDGVSFSLDRGESIGMVGESGCGKTITCLSILRLVPQPAGRIVGGRIFLDGENIVEKTESEMRSIRGRKAVIIPQDPMTSLNPVLSVWSQLSEVLRLHQHLRGKTLWTRARDMLRLVRIPDPEARLRSFPHQLSGGMRQRVAGAMSLSCQPKLLIADEPTTSLDVTIETQFLTLLTELRQQLGVALIFVTHDFGIVERMCDRVAVMYAGKIVEEAPTREIFEAPLHPYTVALMKALPNVKKKVERLTTIEGQPPPLIDLPAGCLFLPRCQVVDEQCQLAPPMVARNSHMVRCWRYS